MPSIDPIGFEFLSCVRSVDCISRVCTGEFSLAANSGLWTVHFPGNPILPGTLQVEILAQLSAVLVMQLNDFAVLPILIGVDEAKFRRPIGATDYVRCETRMTYNNGAMHKFKGEMLTDGHWVSSASITLLAMKNPNAELLEYLATARMSVERAMAT